MTIHEYEIVSINVGKPKTLVFEGKELSTGIYKKPVHEPVFLSFLNFESDGQADLVHHGGKDKAVCVYPYDHYAYWEKELGRELEAAAFGENLTVKGLVEEDVCIGDMFQLGEAIVQVSQPWQPCYKLAKKYNVEDLPLRVQNTGYTGFYFRVLKEGWVTRESRLQLLSRHPLGITVSFANHIMYHDKYNQEGIERILGVQELSESWRTTLLKRLKNMETDEKHSKNGSTI
ncbi:MOSC domain-containing protein YiiM [Anoxybacillus calidus]|uniref:MOSC domain-containing protein YiiM n=1 Tax=[Anoxybacillus] calidus TaxID=575178 RepID=A0A7W0BVS7_9BACL|nr:MOSC domain-containing protein [Anoxybacillus calidus]MBA2870294.1 MOSC domain-containing protein YiiM [Anoxybacillus calidus]